MAVPLQNPEWRQKSNKEKEEKKKSQTIQLQKKNKLQKKKNTIYFERIYLSDLPSGATWCHRQTQTGSRLKILESHLKAPAKNRTHRSSEKIQTQIQRNK